VLFQIARALGGFPREVHKPNNTYENIYCKLNRKPANSFNDPARGKAPGKPEAPQIGHRDGRRVASADFLFDPGPFNPPARGKAPGKPEAPQIGHRDGRRVASADFFIRPWPL
jgi:hypothetical protein